MKVQRNRKEYFYIIIVSCILFFLFACKHISYTDAKSQKVIVLLSGSEEDMSWNKANIDGIKSYNAKNDQRIEYIENIAEKDFERKVLQYADQGYGLIIGAGAQFNDVIEATAPQYKNTLFCIINGSFLNQKNIVSVQIKEEEAAYIASCIAGKLTKTGVFANIAGFPNEPMKKMLDIYEKNAVRVARERGLGQARCLRAYTNSWDNIDLGYKITEQVLEENADIVLVYANKVWQGSLKALQEEPGKANMIGIATNQCSIDENIVLASVIFDFDKVYTCIMDGYKKGHLGKQRVYPLGMSQDLFHVQYSKKIRGQVIEEIDTVQKDLKAGRINLGKE